MSAELFDKSREYDDLLARGLRVTGESKDYFMRGRIADLRQQLGVSPRPQRILDFGCGIGDTAVHLASVFPEAFVLGVDTAEGALRHARDHHGSERIQFCSVAELEPRGDFDLCYCNGVFHHIVPAERVGALHKIRAALTATGRFALMENNPWNPGTLLVMSRIPFDADALPLSVLHARRLLADAGFAEVAAPRFLFYFPHWLSALRVTERWLARVPLGGQYYLLATNQ